MNVDELLDAAKPQTRTVPVCLDGTIAEPLEDLRARWAALASAGGDTLAPSPELAEVKAQIKALEDKADAATKHIVVQSIGGRAWRKLVAEHPPTDPQYLWDLDTFPPAAVAACCVDPQLTVEQAERLADVLTDGQWDKLYKTVLLVNRGDDLIPKYGPGIGLLPTSE